MKRNILQNLSITALLLVSFGCSKAQGNLQNDVFAYVNTASAPNTVTNQFTSAGNVKIGDLMPNLSSSKARVRVNSMNPVTMKVRFFMITGDLVKEEALDLNSGESELNVNLDDLSQGIYIIQFYSKEGSAIRRIVKTN